jgi:hypothetical protein
MKNQALSPADSARPADWSGGTAYATACRNRRFWPTNLPDVFHPVT